MTPEPAPVVLDLHGLLAIGLVGATTAEVAAVRRQLGPLPAVAGREPDVLIRFVDRIAIEGSLRPLGREAAHDDTSFLVLRGRRKARVRVAVPVDRLGTRPIELVAERGLPAVPYLLPIINLTMLSAGIIPVHASAFIADGRGMLVTGWAKGGKSEALLAFADHGATYVGDEWVFVTGDGSSMAGLPEPMRVWDWQLDQVTHLRDRIGLGRRLRLGAAAGTSRVLRATSQAPLVRSTAPGDTARRLEAIAEQQRSLQIPPARIFDGRIAAGPTALDVVILIETVLDSGPTVEPIAPAEVARRAAATIAYESLDVQALALAYRYAFPDRDVPILTSLAATIEERLGAAISSKPCLLVRHPSPADIPALHDLIAVAIAELPPPAPS
jgi:hypothetical protein